MSNSMQQELSVMAKRANLSFPPNVAPAQPEVSVKPEEAVNPAPVKVAPEVVKTPEDSAPKVQVEPEVVNAPEEVQVDPEVVKASEDSAPKAETSEVKPEESTPKAKKDKPKGMTVGAIINAKGSEWMITSVNHSAGINEYELEDVITHNKYRLKLRQSMFRRKPVDYVQLSWFSMNKLNYELTVKYDGIVVVVLLVKSRGKLNKVKHISVVDTKNDGPDSEPRITTSPDVDSCNSITCVQKTLFQFILNKLGVENIKPQRVPSGSALALAFEEAKRNA